MATTSKKPAPTASSGFSFDNLSKLLNSSAVTSAVSNLTSKPVKAAPAPAPVVVSAPAPAPAGMSMGMKIGIGAGVFALVAVIFYSMRK